METIDNPLPRRKRLRPDWLDMDEGNFLVTVNVKNHRCSLGEITDGHMLYTKQGEIALCQIAAIPDRFPMVEIVCSVVMPNHFHIVISLDRHNNSTENRYDNQGCLKPNKHLLPMQSDETNYHHNSMLSIIVGGVKAGITRDCHRAGLEIEWQSRFDERKLNDQMYFDSAVQYVKDNIINWEKDRYHQ